MRRLLILFLVIPLLSPAQQHGFVLKTSGLTKWTWLTERTSLFYDSLQRPGPAADSLTVVRAQYKDATVPLENTPFPHFVFFTISNDQADSANYYLYQFSAGYTEVYERPVGSAEPWKQVAQVFVPSTVVEREVFPVRLGPGQSKEFQVRVAPLMDTFYRIQCYLIPAADTNQFFGIVVSVIWGLSVRNIWMCGMLLMMLLYVLTKYWQIRSPVYLYYSLYIFFFFAFFFFRELAEWNKALARTPFYYRYLEQMFQIAAYTMYFPFAQRFINTRVLLPTIDKWMTRIVRVLIAYMAVNLILMYIPSMMLFRWHLWDGVRIFLLISELSFTLLLLRARSPYIRYLVIGSALLAFFAMLAMIFSIDESWIREFPFGLNHAITYFQIGVVLEILFFSSVLGYKHRRDEVQRIQAQEALKREAERNKFQQYRLIMEALEGERGRIAKDLHDGLGGMLSGVKFSLSNIRSRIQLKEDEGLLYERAVDQLGGSIRELRRVAHDMMPDVLVIQGLSAAVADYCTALRDMGVLTIRFQAVGEEKRSEAHRELIVYRMIQELITNVIRHAGATELLVQLVYTEDQLAITVEDNGRGFNAEHDKNGIGLTNVRSRSSFLGGRLNLTSSHEGTSVYIEIPVA